MATAKAADATIRFAAFNALSASTFHDLLKLRFDVFVLEQQSLYPEIDGQDPAALHMIVETGATLVGTARLLGLAGTGPISIGRVALAKGDRGQGLGRVMIATALTHIRAAAPGRDQTLGAQHHLEPFYAGFGFRRISDIYDDGGIPHVDMLRPADMVAP